MVPTTEETDADSAVAQLVQEMLDNGPSEEQLEAAFAASPELQQHQRNIAASIAQATKELDASLAEFHSDVERDLVILERIHTSVNEADHLTKILDRTLFYRHVDHLMGHVPPAYSPKYGEVTGKGQMEMLMEEIQMEDLAIRPDARFRPIPARAAMCSIGSDNWYPIVVSTTCFQSDLCFLCHPTSNCGGVLVVDNIAHS